MIIVGPFELRTHYDSVTPKILNSDSILKWRGGLTTPNYRDNQINWGWRCLDIQYRSDRAECWCSSVSSEASTETWGCLHKIHTCPPPKGNPVQLPSSLSLSQLHALPSSDEEFVEVSPARNGDDMKCSLCQPCINMAVRFSQAWCCQVAFHDRQEERV